MQSAKFSYLPNC